MESTYLAPDFENTLGPMEEAGLSDEEEKDGPKNYSISRMTNAIIERYSYFL